MMKVLVLLQILGISLHLHHAIGGRLIAHVGGRDHDGNTLKTSTLYNMKQVDPDGFNKDMMHSCKNYGLQEPEISYISLDAAWFVKGTQESIPLF